MSLPHSTPIRLIPGKDYTYELTEAVAHRHSLTDVYPDGRSSVQSRDLAFRAHLEVCN